MEFDEIQKIGCSQPQLCNPNLQDANIAVAESDHEAKKRKKTLFFMLRRTSIDMIK